MPLSKIESAGLGAGTVLQVVNTTYATSTSTTSSSYVDTGVTATITPKFATSKILIIVNMQMGMVGSGSCGVRVLRGASLAVGVQNAVFYSTGNSRGTVSTSYLDSPATTSATTYKVQHKTNGSGTSTVSQDGADDVCTLTLLEIAA